MNKLPGELQASQVPPVTFHDGQLSFYLHFDKHRWVLLRNEEPVGGLDQEGLHILYMLLLQADSGKEASQKLVGFLRMRRIWSDEATVPIVKGRIYTQIIRIRKAIDQERQGRPSLIRSQPNRGYYYTGDQIAFHTRPRRLRKSVRGEVKTSPSLRAVKKIFLTDGLLGVDILEVSKRDSGRVLVPNLEGLRFPLDQFVFVDDDHLNDICGEINANAFGRPHADGTALWAGSSEERRMNVREKIRRNRTHYKKNKYSLMLIRSFDFRAFKPKGDFIGFSHILPMTRLGHEDYCRGSIKDNNLLGDLIARPNETAKSLLMFSIAVDTYGYLRKAYEGMPAQYREDGEWAEAISTLLVNALAYHMQVLLQIHQGSEDKLPIIAQNDGSADVINFLDLVGFEKTHDRTKDGCLIWEDHARRSSTPVRVP